MGKKRGSATAKGSNKKAQQKQPQRSGVLASPRKFARDVRGELRRVSWPDRDQLRQELEDAGLAPDEDALGPVSPDTLDEILEEMAPGR